jgi:hypothetical protein
VDCTPEVAYIDDEIEQDPDVVIRTGISEVHLVVDEGYKPVVEMLDEGEHVEVIKANQLGKRMPLFNVKENVHTI